MTPAAYNSGAFGSPLGVANANTFKPRYVSILNL
jgi:hypothetical protein